MSWVEWQGGILPTTTDIASLSLTVEAGDTRCPPQRWSFELSHCQPRLNRTPDDWHYELNFNVAIDDLCIEVRDWRELAGLTIRSTPQWLAGVEACGAYGQLRDPSLEITYCKVSSGKKEFEMWEEWQSIEYELRFGRWDEGCLACELDAWVMRKKDFHRTTPETQEELDRFAVGPPNLRVITGLAFRGGRIEMERCGDDPVPLALQRLKAQVGDVKVAGTKVHWPHRYANGDKQPPVQETGWRGAVNFSTGW